MKIDEIWKPKPTVHKLPVVEHGRPQRIEGLVKDGNSNPFWFKMWDNPLDAMLTTDNPQWQDLIHCAFINRERLAVQLDADGNVVSVERMEK